MTKVLRLVSVCCFLHLMGAGAAHSKPPGPGKHFDCSDAPGATSCATDDAGCVSNTNDHRKCAVGFILPLGKLLAKLAGCHYKQAFARMKGTAAGTADSTEDGCESSFTVPPTPTPMCDPAQITAADGLFGSIFSSLDPANGNIYCDSTSGALIGGDDTGWVPASRDILTCERNVARNLIKLTAFGLKCQRKMNNSFFRGNRFDEEACEAHALAQYNRRRGALLNHWCAHVSCQDQAHQDAAAADVLNQVDGSDSSAFFPCGLSSPSGAFLDAVGP